MKVYQAIAAVQGELAKTGIAKNRKNTQGSGFMFRGIDDVYAALSPLLAQHGLCIIPRMMDREQVERATKSGGTLFYTTVKAEFDFVGVEDGSKHTACTYGEAMDSGDKATNKAMSAAYKYAAFLTFAIPTEGDNDADGTTHEVAPRQATPRHDPPVEAVITDEQRHLLISLMEAKGIGAREFCDVGKIASLKDLRARGFGRAKAWIEAQPAKPVPVPANGAPILDDDIPF